METQEKAQPPKKRSVRIDEDVDTALTAAAMKNRIPKGDVIRQLVDQLNEAEEAKRNAFNRDMELAKSANTMGLDLNEVLKWKMFSSMGGSQSPMSDTLQQLLVLQAIKSMSGPDPTTLMAMMSKGEGSEAVLAKLEESNRNFQEFMQKFFRQEEKAEAHALGEALGARLGAIEQQIATSGSLAQEISEFTQVKDALTNFAKSVGMTDREIMSDDGSLKWGNVLDKLFGLGEKAIEAFSKQKPPKKAVETISTSGNPTSSSELTAQPPSETPTSFFRDTGEGDEGRADEETGGADGAA